MAFIKILTVIVVVMIVSCNSAPTDSYGGGGGGGYGYQPYHNDYSEPRDYRFNYAINDDYTYNHQTRNENKYGKTVTGQYTVLEPTGELRVVNYIADDYGFRAEVQHQPHGSKTY